MADKKEKVKKRLIKAIQISYKDLMAIEQKERITARDGSSSGLLEDIREEAEGKKLLFNIAVNHANDLGITKKELGI